MSIVFQEPWSGGFSALHKIREVLVRKQTKYQELMVAETETFGRALFLDRLIQSAQTDEALYHEALVHPALVVHGHPRRVLIGGTGEGATLREVLRHPDVEQVVSVDLDNDVVQTCRELLPQWNAGAFNDPRVELRTQNVYDTLASNHEPFDIIVLDITDPVEDGPSADLFTTEFFTTVADHLADDGVAVIQSGELDIGDCASARVVRSTLLEVFPWVRFVQTYVPSFLALWSVAMVSKQTREVVPSDLDQRVARLPREKLRVYSATAHRWMVDLPPLILDQLQQPGRIVTGKDADRLITFPSV